MSEPPVSEPPVSVPVSEETPQVQSETMADAFPPAPLSDASSVLSNATQTVQDAAAKMNQSISNGVDSVKSALTSEFDIGDKIKDLFSSDSTVAAPLDAAPLVAAPLDAAPLDAAPLDAAPLVAAVPAPSSAQNQDLVPGPVNVPAIPSLVGGKTRRYTRRKNRRSKSNKKSKKSKSKLN